MIISAAFMYSWLPTSNCPLLAPQALREVLPPLLARVRPQLVLYNAGVDVHADDSLGLVALTNGGIDARDRFVLEACASAGAPVAAAIGGGYHPDHEKIVDRHMLLHRAAADFLPKLGATRSLAHTTARVGSSAGTA
jgi:acetoin utilization deacetylase AcuC-like enzyme